MKKLLFLSSALLAVNCYADGIKADLYADAVSTNGWVENPTYMMSHHHAKVVNHSDHQQNFTVYYSLCAQNKGCNDDHIYTIPLGPNGVWEDGLTLKMADIYHRPGIYTLTATTRVTAPGYDERKTSNATINVR